MEIGLSLINSFQKCRYLWFLTYERAIKPVRRPTAVAMGGLVHLGLAAALHEQDFAKAIYKTALLNAPLVGQDTPGDVFVVAEDVDTKRMAQDAVRITARAMQHLFRSGAWETVYIDEIPLIETKLVVPLTKDIDFVGVVDWVAREKNTNTIWLFDHKVRTHLQPDDTEDFNTQMAVYQKLLWEFDIHCAGSICFQIRSALPSLPKRNINGTMSRADIATDWETYCDALTDAGLNPDDYADMRDRLQGKEFFRLSKSYRSDSLVKAIWQSSILDAIDDILKSRKRFRNDKQGRLPSRNQHLVNCKLCAARDFCQYELRGMDTEYLISSGLFTRG